MSRQSENPNTICIFIYYEGGTHKMFSRHRCPNFRVLCETRKLYNRKYEKTLILDGSQNIRLPDSRCDCQETIQLPWPGNSGTFFIYHGLDLFTYGLSLFETGSQIKRHICDRLITLMIYLSTLELYTLAVVWRKAKLKRSMWMVKFLTVRRCGTFAIASFHDLHHWARSKRILQ